MELHNLWKENSHSEKHIVSGVPPPPLTFGSITISEERVDERIEEFEAEIEKKQKIKNVM